SSPIGRWSKHLSVPKRALAGGGAQARAVDGVKSTCGRRSEASAVAERVGRRSSLERQSDRVDGQARLARGWTSEVEWHGGRRGRKKMRWRKKKRARSTFH
ncbi:hypothetical protein E2562_012397, partial [Oryza meyeriana var. granulata]